MYVLYYASMLRCWHLVWIMFRTNHPCLGVGCHMWLVTSLILDVWLLGSLLLGRPDLRLLRSLLLVRSEVRLPRNLRSRRPHSGHLLALVVQSPKKSLLSVSGG
jgi:hypothetical protein